MEITKYYSPNHTKKVRSAKSITMIIIHYTGMQSERESLKRLTSLKSKVSAHYLIGRNGRTLNLVEPRYVAWHAGKSMWKKNENLNKNSIGIELVNKGHKFGYQKFTKIQIKNLIFLCGKLKKKYKIKNQYILGHSDIAPLRKIDPGEKFPWHHLSINGIGNYPKKIKLKDKHKKAQNNHQFFKNLHKIGYRYLNTKYKTKIIKNFQRKYRQKKINGIIDFETLKLSQILSKSSN